MFLQACLYDDNSIHDYKDYRCLGEDEEGYSQAFRKFMDVCYDSRDDDAPSVRDGEHKAGDEE